MRFPTNTKIQTAVLREKARDLSCQHLTTQNFMDLNVAYAREFPKGKIRCNVKSFIRMAPMLKPTLGSIQVHNRAFFVPFRVVWNPFESFVTDTPFVTSEGSTILNNVPTFDRNVLVIAQFLSDSRIASTFSTEPSAFDYYDGANYFVLKPFGRFAVKTLESLGYKLVGKYFTLSISCLPLLCLAKAYFDWYQPAQYAHIGSSAIVEGLFNRNFRYDLTLNETIAILEFIHYVCYDSDYFTAAFDSPVSPSLGVFSTDYNIRDITLDLNYQNSVENRNTTIPPQPDSGTPYIGAGNSDPTSVITALTQYQLNALSALDSYLHRHALVGAQVINRYLADFGVKLSAEALKRSYYVGKQSFPIQIQDITATADTSGAALGDYAGKGVGFDGDGNFEFDNEEFGYFFVLSTIVPDIAYYQGLDRFVLHTSRLDFLNNQFEELGTQPINTSELIVSKKNPNLQSNNLIFGFTPRYAEYKTGSTSDRVTGDFVFDSVNVGLTDGWNTARVIDPNDSLTSPPIHNIDFVLGKDSMYYNRIFYGFVDAQGETVDVDGFYVVHRINIKDTFSHRDLYDTYDFDADGKEITTQANGIKVN